jgi:hypothetical protein
MVDLGGLAGPGGLGTPSKRWGLSRARNWEYTRSRFLAEFFGQPQSESIGTRMAPNPMNSNVFGTRMAPNPTNPNVLGHQKDPEVAVPRIRPAKVRLNSRLDRRDSEPYSANYPKLEYGRPSGAAAGGSGWPAVFELRVVRQTQFGMPAAKPKIQTDFCRAYSGPRPLRQAR